MSLLKDLYLECIDEFFQYPATYSEVFVTNKEPPIDVPLNLTQRTQYGPKQVTIRIETGEVLVKAKSDGNGSICECNLHEAFAVSTDLNLVRLSVVYDKRDKMWKVSNGHQLVGEAPGRDDAVRLAVEGFDRYFAQSRGMTWANFIGMRAVEFAKARSNDKIAVYYDWNRNAFDVEDRSTGELLGKYLFQDRALIGSESISPSKAIFRSGDTEYHFEIEDMQDTIKGVLRVDEWLGDQHVYMIETYSGGDEKSRAAARQRLAARISTSLVKRGALSGPSEGVRPGNVTESDWYFYKEALEQMKDLLSGDPETDFLKHPPMGMNINLAVASLHSESFGRRAMPMFINKPVRSPKMWAIFKNDADAVRFFNVADAVEAIEHPNIYAQREFPADMPTPRTYRPIPWSELDSPDAMLMHRSVKKEYLNEVAGLSPTAKENEMASEITNKEMNVLGNFLVTFGVNLGAEEILDGATTFLAEMAVNNGKLELAEAMVNPENEEYFRAATLTMCLGACYLFTLMPSTKEGASKVMATLTPMAAIATSKVAKKAVNKYLLNGEERRKAVANKVAALRAKQAADAIEAADDDQVAKLAAARAAKAKSM